MRREIAEYLTYAIALGLTERSVSNYRLRLHRFSDYAADREIAQVQDVTIELIRDYHDEMRRRNLKVSSRRGFLSIIRAFLSWAHESGRIPADLAVRVELPRREHKLPPRPLTRGDMDKLLRIFCLRGAVSLRNRAILELLYACGLRKSELLALNIGDLDFVEGTVFVRLGKGNKDRLLPIHHGALSAVTAYLSTRPPELPRSAPLFVTTAGPGLIGKRLNIPNLDGIFRQINHQFHKHVYPHLLRHTFAVHLLLGGADIRHVQALLGHESPDTTSQYLGLVKEDIKKAYDQAIERILTGAIPAPRRPGPRRPPPNRTNPPIRSLQCPFGPVKCPHAPNSTMAGPPPDPVGQPVQHQSGQPAPPAPPP